MNPSNEDNYEHVEKKPIISEPKKSSMQILSELFSTFDAEPPVIVKKEKSEKEKKKDKEEQKKSTNIRIKNTRKKRRPVALHLVTNRK